METALREAISESLAAYVYPNAIFLAERLFAEAPTLSNLHTLAHCYVVSGDAITANHLLEHVLGCQSIAARSAEEAAEAADGAASPLWRCRYLLAVTAAMTDRHQEAEAILTELTPATPEVKYWLGVCGRSLCRRWAGDNFFKAVSSNTNLFVSYESAVKCAGRFPSSPYDRSTPTEGHFSRASAATHRDRQHYDPSSSPARQQASSRSGGAPVRGGIPERPAGRARGGGVPREAATGNSGGGGGGDGGGGGGGGGADAAALYALLRKFAHVARLLHDFKCPEAIGQLQALPPAQRRSGWGVVAHALASFHSGNYTEAWASFKVLREREPWRLRDPALIAASTALWHLKKDVELGTLAQALVQVAPLSPVTMCVVGNCYSLAREHRAAIQILTRATQADKELAVGFALRGHEHMALDQRTEAQQCYDSALRLDPRLYIGYAGMGELHLRLDKVAKAQRYFQRAIEINALPSIQNRLGATFLREGAERESLHSAMAIFDRVLAAAPGNYGAKIQRAMALHLLQRHEEALEQLRSLAQEHPTEAMVRIRLGECLVKLDRRSEAVRAFHEALDLDPRRSAQIKRWLEALSAAPRTATAAAATAS